MQSSRQSQLPNKIRGGLCQGCVTYTRAAESYSGSGRSSPRVAGKTLFEDQVRMEETILRRLSNPRGGHQRQVWVGMLIFSFPQMASRRNVLGETKGSLESISMQTGIDVMVVNAVHVKRYHDSRPLVRHSRKEDHTVVIRCTIRVPWYKNRLYFCHHCEQELTLYKKEKRARVVMTRP